MVAVGLFRVGGTISPSMISPRAPTVSIDGGADILESATLALSATVEGGFYDSLAYEWEVVSGGGTFDDTAAQSVVYDPADVDADTEVQVRVTVTASGNGMKAADGESDTATATTTFTVSFVESPGAAIYQQFVDAGMSVLRAQLGASYASGTNRYIYDPTASGGTATGESLASHVLDGLPTMPVNMRIRRGGSHSNRITFAFASGAVNPATYLYNGGVEGRYMYMVTVGTHNGAHEWICVDTTNATSQGNVGGSTWMNLYPSDSRASNVNVEEDVVAGNLAGNAISAGNAAESAYNTWREASIVLEASDDEVELIIAFGDDATVDPNA